MSLIDIRSCHVCGTVVKDYDDKRATKIGYVFSDKDDNTIGHFKQGKERKKGNQGHRLDLNSIENTTSNYITSDGKLLEQILRTVVEYNLSTNAICSKCFEQIRLFEKLSLDLEKLRCEIKNTYDAKFATNERKTSDPLEKGAVNSIVSHRKSRRLRNYKRHNDNDTPADSAKIPTLSKFAKASDSSTRNSSNQISSSILNDLEQNSNALQKSISTSVNDAGMDVDTTKLSTVVIQAEQTKSCHDETNSKLASSRKSARIRKNATKLVKKEENKPTLVAENLDCIEALLDPLDKQILPNEIDRNSSTCQINLEETETREKSIDSRHTQVKQANIVDRNVSHPCEICK